MVTYFVLIEGSFITIPDKHYRIRLLNVFFYIKKMVTSTAAPAKKNLKACVMFFFSLHFFFFFLELNFTDFTLETLSSGLVKTVSYSAKKLQKMWRGWRTRPS